MPPAHAAESTDAAQTTPAGGATAGPRVVCGIDGSTASLAALDWAARQASLTGVPLEIVAVWEWPTALGYPAYYPENFDPAADVRTLLQAAEARAREAHPDLTISPLLVEGHPAPVLVERSAGADVLVVGSRGHGEFMGMLLGSVGAHCVAHARCPVLIHRDVPA